MVDVQADGSEKPLPPTKYFIPGAILNVAVDNTNPLAYGLDKHVDVVFDNSPVLQLAPDATLRGVRPVSWFDSKEPLRSGWAWGQHYLEGGTTAIEASIGKSATGETAVMFDTFRPLAVTAEAVAIEEPDYAFSWLPGRHNGAEQAATHSADAAR